MTQPTNREGRVAIIVTAREYQALNSATVTYENAFFTDDNPLDASTRADLRALQKLLSKCQDAGIRTD